MFSETSGYRVRRGTGLDRASLVKFMQRTYQELYPEAQLHHLAQTVDQYFSGETPLWWVDSFAPSLPPLAQSSTQPPIQSLEQPLEPTLAHSALQPTERTLVERTLAEKNPVACLWLGRAVDQVSGQGYPYIFLLYVSPAHRRRGIGSSLIHQAEAWATARGDWQLGLQVFHHNQPALRLYEALGFQPQAIAMVKSLRPNQLP